MLNLSTIFHRQRTLNLSLPYRRKSGPPTLLFDSTGIKAEGEGELECLKAWEDQAPE
jgi:hypothetical protein